MVNKLQALLQMNALHGGIIWLMRGEFIRLGDIGCENRDDRVAISVE